MMATEKSMIFSFNIQVMLQVLLIFSSFFKITYRVYMHFSSFWKTQAGILQLIFLIQWKLVKEMRRKER